MPRGKGLSPTKMSRFYPANPLSWAWGEEINLFILMERWWIAVY
jgi:hypothetical protein